MSNKKYEILIGEENTIEFEGRTLHRIRALKDFGDVKKGDIGGFVENDYNLSHEGNCWIYDNAKAMDNSRIYGDSEMYENSKMYGNSAMYEYGELNNNDQLYGKLVSKVDDYVEINNPKGRLVTCVRKGNNIFYNVGCQDEIDEETFKYRIEHENGGLENNPHRKYYYKIIEESKILLLNK